MLLTEREMVMIIRNDELCHPNLLSIDMVKYLSRLHVLWYQITLDGGKTTRDYYRPLQDGSGSYCHSP